ncbi:MAG: ABC transporter permease subunit [Gammaproteobacteria bacterium]|nr:ABC transporter permease subunit [Gammaproteobacteria bacterium]
MITTIALREFRNLFISPLAWTILAVITAIIAYLFLIKIEIYIDIQPRLIGMKNPPGISEMIIIPLLSEASTLLLLITPLISMHLFSGERQQHTLTLLFSSPISISEIVLGKYLGLLGFFIILLGLISLMPLSLLAGATIDTGRLYAALLGLALLLASFSAIGLLMSSLTHSPTIAATGTFGVLLLLWIIDWAGTNPGNSDALFSYISILRHQQSFMNGMVNSSDVFYFLLLIITSLGLSINHLDMSRR